MPKRRTATRIAGLLAVAVVTAGTAVAQTGTQTLAPPLLLIRPVPGATPDAAAPDGAVPGSSAESSGPIIAVNDLAAPRPDAMGLMDSRSGGFPDDMWQGSQPETARGLVAALPHRTALLSARRLAKRFLLSAAPPPTARRPVAPVQDAPAPPVEGQAPEPETIVEPPPVDAAEPPSSALLEARIAALAGMAAWSDALALIDFLPTASRSAALQHVQVDGLLMVNKIEAACGEAQRALEDTPDVHWQQVQVFCQFATGQINPASLALDLLREQGVDDKAFFWAAEILKGGTAAMPADVTKPGAATPLVLAMLRKASCLLPAELIATDDPSVLLVGAEIAAAPVPPPPLAPPPAPKPARAPAKVATEKPAPEKAAPEPADDLRLLTVERAVLAGVADVETLRALYAKTAVSAEAKASGQIAATTARQRAATYQLAAAQNVPTARAEVISRIYDLVRPRGAATADSSVMLAALVYAPMVLDLSPAADVSWFAGTAARVLLAADLAGGVDPRADPAAPDQGLRNAGRAWLDLVHGMAATSSEARAVNDALWPLQQLVSGGAVSGDALRAWVATLPKEPAVDALQRQELLLGLLTSLGDDVTIADWQPLLAQGAPPAEAAAPVASPLLWQAVTLAAKARHIGDCVALSLQLVGGDTGQQPPRLAVLKAIESLTTAGRVVDARPLAIETALVQGL